MKIYSKNKISSTMLGWKGEAIPFIHIFQLLKVIHYFITRSVFVTILQKKSCKLVIIIWKRNIESHKSYKG